MVVEVTLRQNDLFPLKRKETISCYAAKYIRLLQNMGDQTYWVSKKGEMAVGNNMADFDLGQLKK